MNGYNGDSITESEWYEAENIDIEQEKMFGECLICGSELDEDGHCENGCDIED